MIPALRRVVSHPVFGEGEVLDSRWGGTELLCSFASGLRLWLPTRRLRLIRAVTAELAAGVSPRVSSVTRIQARRMLEAFRLGIVPVQDIETFTFGREREVRVVEAMLSGLAQGTGDVCLVEGEYGTGKTHLLEHIHHRALKEGFCATICRLDPLEVTPHRPKRVYREAISNLRYLRDGRECGYRDLLREAIKFDLGDHVFFGPVLAKLERLDAGKLESEVFWQWIEGESTKEYATDTTSLNRVRGGQRIPALYDFSTAADFYCNIFSALSWIARQLGLKGLVLLLDEAETVTRLWDVVYLAKSVNFMEGLVRTARNDPELRRGNSRLIHNRVRPVPYIYRDPSLLLVFATTPMPYEYGYLKLANRIDRRVILAPLEDRALVEAFGTLVTLYHRAYEDFTISELDQKRVFRGAVERGADGVRTFIKYCVESMDAERYASRMSAEAGEG
ncbi:MAG: BREX system ATP-binding domain-containing protein [bacterium]